MPAELVDIDLADLIVDVRNARLREEQANEQAALLAIAEKDKRHLLKIATDIIQNGLDPLSLVGVVPTNDQQKRYVVLEGNRRVAALKALETPSIVSPALGRAEQTRLNKLAERFAQNPIKSVRCALFSSEEELEHWITLRHTGQNAGVGLVEWGAEEKDRYTARHGKLSAAGQIIEFVTKQGELSEEAKDSSKGIITNLTRLINTPKVREMLGVEIVDGHIFSHYPVDEVEKGLTRVVEDLRTERIRVNDIYYAGQREHYVENLPDSEKPNPSTRRERSWQLQYADTQNTDNQEAETVASTQPTTRRRRRRTPRGRTAVIPQSCQLDISPPRINSIYNELLKLSADQYTNACSVTLRVFVELSVDHYLVQENIMTESEMRSIPLARRLKVAADDLLQRGKIGTQLKDAVYRVADNRRELSASTVTFNQYVHNEYVYPRAGELRIAWDELQPFVERLWP